MPSGKNYILETLISMIRNSALLFTGLGFFFLVEVAGAQQVKVFSAEAEKLFAKGLDAYKKEEYQKAQDRFQKLLEFPLNQRSSVAQLMMSKTSFRLEDFGLALSGAKQLQRRYADSRYVPDSYLIAGDCYFLLRRYYEAATQYSRILATPASLPLQASAAERLAGVVKNGYISARALESIGLSLGETRLQDALLYGEARWYQRLGWEEQSRLAMQNYDQNIPDGIFLPLAGLHAESGIILPPVEETLPAEEVVGPDEGKQRPRLGLLLPLSGPYRQYGADLLDGVRLANRELDEPFELVAADTGFEYGELPIVEGKGNELLRTVEATKSLIEEEKVVALIGPVFSGASIAAGVVADAAGVPLIAPLAQQSGLDELGDYVFQLNVIPEVQGRALGEYATLVLGLKNLAVLAPLSGYGWTFERAFADSAHANGGDIVYTGWYVPGETKDFKHIFEEMREIGFSLIPPPPPEDSLAVADSLVWMTDDGIVLETSEIEEEEEEAPPDSSEIFIDTIDGVVIVVESFEDANTIAPQLRFHRLDTQILGNDIWYEPEAIRQMLRGDREYIKGAIFISRYRDSAPLARKFIDAFRREFKRDPGYAAYGYDAALMLMEGWARGRHSPSALRDWLAEIRGFEGATGKISFLDGRRTNSEIELLKIAAGGRVRPLKLEDLPDLSIREERLPDLDLPEAEVELEEADSQIEE
jgi:ABC-type branched-subunit amino acid transport system substrate-binding protein